MNIFQEAWMLMKAIDPNDFDIGDILSDEVFPKGRGHIMRYLETPKGKREMNRIRARRIDYPLEGMDLPDFQFKDKWRPEEEFQRIFGGSPAQVKNWDFLSKPGKMINRTFSLPTHMCRIGGQLREVPGSVCHNCYAHGKNYNYNAVQQRLLRNYNALTGGDPMEWASAFASKIIPKETPHFPMFRFHDSGDLHSASHASMIADIASQNPDVLHWIPTREWKMIEQLVNARNELPANFVPRISLPMVNQTIDNEENERRGVPLLDEKIISLIEDNPQVDYSTVIDRPEYKSSKASVLCGVESGVEGRKKCQDLRCDACYQPNVKAIDYSKH